MSLTVTLKTPSREVVINRGIDVEDWGIVENAPKMRTKLSGSRSGFNPSALIVEGNLTIKLVDKDEADAVRDFINDYLKFSKTFDIYLDSGDIGAGDSQPLLGCFWIGEPTTKGYIVPRGRGIKWDIKIPYRCPLTGLKSIWNELPPVTFTLDRVDYAIVNMIADNPNVNTFQLRAYDTDDNDVTDKVTWVSGISTIQVNSSGLMTCIGDTNGTYNVSALYGGVTRWCSVQGFATLPSDATIDTLPGSKGGNVTGSLAVTDQFEILGTLPFVPASHRVKLKSYTSSTGSMSVEAFEQSGVGGLGVYISDGGKPRIVEAIGAAGFTRNYPASLSSNTKYTLDFGKSSEGYRYNGATVSAVNIASFTPTTSGIIRLRYTNNCDKIYSQSWHSTSISEMDLGEPSKCDIYYCPVIFRVKTGVNNYVEIPNIGLLGSPYDYKKDNISSAWFNV